MAKKKQSPLRERTIRSLRKLGFTNPAVEDLLRRLLTETPAHLTPSLFQADPFEYADRMQMYETLFGEQAPVPEEVGPPLSKEEQQRRLHEEILRRNAIQRQLNEFTGASELGAPPPPSPDRPAPPPYPPFPPTSTPPAPVAEDPYLRQTLFPFTRSEIDQEKLTKIAHLIAQDDINRDVNIKSFDKHRTYQNDRFVSSEGFRNAEGALKSINGDLNPRRFFSPFAIKILSDKDIDIPRAVNDIQYLDSLIKDRTIKADVARQVLNFSIAHQRISGATDPTLPTAGNPRGNPKDTKIIGVLGASPKYLKSDHRHKETAPGEKYASWKEGTPASIKERASDALNASKYVKDMLDAAYIDALARGQTFVISTGNGLGGIDSYARKWATEVLTRRLGRTPTPEELSYHLHLEGAEMSTTRNNNVISGLDPNHDAAIIVTAAGDPSEKANGRAKQLGVRTATVSLDSGQISHQSGPPEQKVDLIVTESDFAPSPKWYYPEQAGSGRAEQAQGGTRGPVPRQTTDAEDIIAALLSDDPPPYSEKLEALRDVLYDVSNPLVAERGYEGAGEPGSEEDPRVMLEGMETRDPRRDTAVGRTGDQSREEVLERILEEIADKQHHTGQTSEEVVDEWMSLYDTYQEETSRAMEDDAMEKLRGDSLEDRQMLRVDDVIDTYYELAERFGISESQMQAILESYPGNIANDIIGSNYSVAEALPEHAQNIYRFERDIKSTKGPDDPGSVFNPAAPDPIDPTLQAQSNVGDDYISRPVPREPFISAEEIIRSASERQRVVHSGGAKGADKAWEDLSRGFATPVHYQVEGQPTPHGNTDVSKGEAAEADQHLRKANETLGRDLDKVKEYTKNLFRRNWSQVKNSDAVYAITNGFDAPNIVSGGTGWAVQMAIDNGKPVYIFDQSGRSGNWQQWNYDTGQFEYISKPPVPPQNFAGIGTRKINQRGVDAIKTVYSGIATAEISGIGSVGGSDSQRGVSEYIVGMMDDVLDFQRKTKKIWTGEHLHDRSSDSKYTRKTLGIINPEGKWEYYDAGGEELAGEEQVRRIVGEDLAPFGMDALKRKIRAVPSTHRLSMDFEFGKKKYSPKSAPHVSAKNTFDAVLEGTRTATTGKPRQFEKVNIGDLIEIHSKNDASGSKVHAIVTAKRDTDGLTPEQWAGKEGYDPNVAEESWNIYKEGHTQIEYEVVAISRKDGSTHYFTPGIMEPYYRGPKDPLTEGLSKSLKHEKRIPKRMFGAVSYIDNIAMGNVEDFAAEINRKYTAQDVTNGLKKPDGTPVTKQDVGKNVLSVDNLKEYMKDLSDTYQYKSRKKLVEDLGTLKRSGRLVKRIESRLSEWEEHHPSHPASEMESAQRERDAESTVRDLIQGTRTQRSVPDTPPLSGPMAGPPSIRFSPHQEAQGGAPPPEPNPEMLIREHLQDMIDKRNVYPKNGGYTTAEYRKAAGVDPKDTSVSKRDAVKILRGMLPEVKTPQETVIAESVKELQEIAQQAERIDSSVEEVAPEPRRIDLSQKTPAELIDAWQRGREVLDTVGEFEDPSHQEWFDAVRNELAKRKLDPRPVKFNAVMDNDWLRLARDAQSLLENIDDPAKKRSFHKTWSDSDIQWALDNWDNAPKTMERDLLNNILEVGDALQLQLPEFSRPMYESQTFNVAPEGVENLSDLQTRVDTDTSVERKHGMDTASADIDATTLAETPARTPTPPQSPDSAVPPVDPATTPAEEDIRSRARQLGLGVRGAIGNLWRGASQLWNPQTYNEAGQPIYDDSAKHKSVDHDRIKVGDFVMWTPTEDTKNADKLTRPRRVEEIIRNKDGNIQYKVSGFTGLVDPDSLTSAERRTGGVRRMLTLPVTAPIGAARDFVAPKVQSAYQLARHPVETARAVGQGIKNIATDQPLKKALNFAGGVGIAEGVDIGFDLYSEQFYYDADGKRKARKLDVSDAASLGVRLPEYLMATNILDRNNPEDIRVHDEMEDMIRQMLSLDPTSSEAKSLASKLGDTLDDVITTDGDEEWVEGGKKLWFERKFSEDEDDNLINRYNRMAWKHDVDETMARSAHGTRIFGPSKASDWDGWGKITNIPAFLGRTGLDLLGMISVPASTITNPETYSRMANREGPVVNPLTFLPDIHRTTEASPTGTYFSERPMRIHMDLNNANLPDTDFLDPDQWKQVVDSATIDADYNGLQVWEKLSLDKTDNIPSVKNSLTGTIRPISELSYSGHKDFRNPISEWFDHHPDRAEGSNIKPVYVTIQKPKNDLPARYWLDTPSQSDYDKYDTITHLEYPDAPFRMMLQDNEQNIRNMVGN